MNRIDLEEMGLGVGEEWKSRRQVLVHLLESVPSSPLGQNPGIFLGCEKENAIMHLA